MIAILDYDAGNVKSVENAFRHLGAEAKLTRDIAEIGAADKLVLPGVGDFGASMKKLSEYGLAAPIKEAIEQDKPFLAICVGLQLLFDESEESPDAEGLHIFRGKIKRLPEGDGRKIPQIGWNSLQIEKKDSRLFRDIEDGSFVYFVHSYYLESEDESMVSACSEYGAHIHAAVERGNVYATQFHPEKSSAVGLRMLKNFMEI